MSDSFTPQVEAQRAERLPSNSEGIPAAGPPGCKYGTDTGEQWAGRCQCHKIECRCPPRLRQLADKVIRSEVDLHTQKASGEDAFVYVRGKFCSPEKCAYYARSDGD